MRIGQLSRRSGFTIDAIRFYERRGLLAAPRRSPGGFRLYDPEEVETLVFVRQMQGLGFSLQEIHELICLRSGQAEACAAVRDHLRQKLSQVQFKIRKLHELQRELRVALSKCNRQARRHSARCPILREAKPGREGKR